MLWWQILLIGIGGLLFKYCVCVALCNLPYKDCTNIKEERHNQYIKRNNKAFRKTNNMLHDMSLVI